MNIQTEIRKRKPILLKDQVPMGASFSIKNEDLSYATPLHFHPELELVYHQDVKGYNIIGNYVNKVENGELLLIGKNLPHNRMRDKEYYEAHKDEQAQAIVVRFKEDFLGENFFAVKEFIHVEILFKRAQRGIRFRGHAAQEIFKILRNNINQTGLPALRQLLVVLDIIGKAEEYEILNHVNFASDPNSNDSQKINKVFQYTEKHFRGPIMLTEVAALINITEAAFCRYFKVRTGKSYFQYLTEYRIAHACHLLMEADIDIAEICYQSGFNNPSNFHKQFRKVMKVTPRQYREQLKKKDASDGQE